MTLAKVLYYALTLGVPIVVYALCLWVALNGR